MSKRTYQTIALLTLPLTFVAAYPIGRPLAHGLAALSENVSTLLTLLGYVLGLLIAVVLWGICLAPLRVRAGFEPIRAQLQKLGTSGVREEIAREQKAIAERERSNDPVVRASHHGRLALAGALLSVAALALTWALFEDGYVVLLPLGAAAVSPLLALYHLAQHVRFRMQSAR